jgi:hypothetical protein
MSKKQGFEGGELDDYIGDDELADDEMLIDGDFSEEIPEGEEGMDDMSFEDDEDEEMYAARRPVKKKSSSPAKPPQRQLLAGVVDRSVLSTAKELEDAWKKLCDKLDTSKPKAYSPKAVLKMEDVIEHKSFGIGFVASMLSAQKAEVIFRHGVVKLVCNK